MNCPRDDQISAYADNMLEPIANQEFARHLATCAVCQSRLTEFHTLSQSLQQLPSPQLGFDLAARLQPHFGKRSSPRPVVRRPWLDWGAPGLAAALSIVSGVWLGGALLGAGTAVTATPISMVQVFDPVPPGGLCAAIELCRASAKNSLKGWP